MFGGFEQAIHRIIPDAECVGYSEIDKYANMVMKYNYSEAKNYGNCRDINPDRPSLKKNPKAGGSGHIQKEDETYCLDTGATQAVETDDARIRRLTPVECERLQNFPDGWTSKGINEKGEVVNISDSQRYKMMGNAITCAVAEAVLRRILR